MNFSEMTSEINDQNEQNIIKASENESAKSNLALAAAVQMSAFCCVCFDTDSGQN